MLNEGIERRMHPFVRCEPQVSAGQKAKKDQVNNAIGRFNPTFLIQSCTFFLNRPFWKKKAVYRT